MHALVMYSAMVSESTSRKMWAEADVCRSILQRELELLVDLSNGLIGEDGVL